MAERSTTAFEARLEAAFGAYADEAPVAVDPTAMARHAAAAATARPGARGWLGRSARVLRPAILLAILVVLLLASLVVSGTWRLPSPTPPIATRLYVSDDDTAWVLDSDRAVVTTGTRTGLRGGPCRSTLIGGTMLLAGMGYGRWEFSTLRDETLPLVSAGLDYAGGERWSPDRLKVAMMDFAGTLTVLDFTDPSEVLERSWEVPGVTQVAWAPDSERLLMARRSGDDGLELDLVHIDDQVATSLGRVAVTLVPEDLTLDFVWSPDGRRVALVVLPSNDPTGETDRPLPVLLDGDPVVVGPIASVGAAWSADGERLAFVGESGLLVADAAGIQVVAAELAMEAYDRIAWAADDALIVDQGGRLLLVALDGSSSTILDAPDPAWVWALDGPDLLVARSVDGGVDLAWYAPGAVEPHRTMPLRDQPSQRVATGSACLDVQALPASTAAGPPA